MAIKKFWNYQAAYPWSETRDGTLTDQSRLWLQTLYRTVVNIDTTGGFTAGGDLSGTNTNQTVIGLQGWHVSTTSPTDGQVLTWIAANNDWEPKPPPAPALPVLVRETPAGALNALNQTYSLSFAPNPAASLYLFLNGVEQLLNTDYQITTPTTIMFNIPPAAADWMLAFYTH
jgi:hypothetical protein